MVWVSIWDVTLTDWYGWQGLDWGLFCYLLINEITSSQENITAFCCTIWLRKKLVSPTRWESPISRVFVKTVFFHLLWDRKEAIPSCPPRRMFLPLPAWRLLCLSERHTHYKSKLATQTWSDLWGPLTLCSEDTSFPLPAPETAPNFPCDVWAPQSLGYKQLHLVVTTLCHLLPFKMHRCYFCSKLHYKTSFFLFFFLSFSLPVKIT